MSTTIALIGRANVGKSTLFNLLSGSNKAIVANLAGTTRDRQYALVKRFVQNHFNLIDTGGIENAQTEIQRQTELQTQIALNEASVIFFVVDAQSGLMANDHLIAEKLRKLKDEKAIYLLVNKSDGVNINYATSEFHQLGFGEPRAISAVTKLGVKALMSEIDELYPNPSAADSEIKSIKVAIIGKPNVGKSTLINRIIGENRLITSAEAGTSRDSIEVPFTDGRDTFSLIDTAGIRRKSKIKEALERLTIIKAMQSMQVADVVIFVLDVNDYGTSQDLRLIDLAIQSHKAMLIVINKCDALSKDKLKAIKLDLMDKMNFLSWAEFHYISALKGIGVRQILKKVKSLHQRTMSDLSASKLTETLQKLIQAHPTPKVQNKQIKFRYAHQGGKNPLIIVLHGNHDQALAQSYENYLTSGFRKALNLSGIPLLLQFRKSENPFKDKKNTLSPAQIKKKKRFKRFIQSKK